MDPSVKAVYLTFDDGPIPEATPFVLDTLKRYGIHATFFVVGDNVRKHPDVFRAEFNRYIAEKKMQIVASKIAFNEDGSATYDLTLRMSSDFTLNDLSGFLESQEGVREIRCELGK